MPSYRQIMEDDSDDEMPKGMSYEICPLCDKKYNNLIRGDHIVDITPAAASPGNTPLTIRVCGYCVGDHGLKSLAQAR